MGYEDFKCVRCGKIFPRRDKCGNGTMKIKGARSSKSITCSKECSKEYQKYRDGRYKYFHKASRYLENNCFFSNSLEQLRKLNLDYDYCEDICKKGFQLSNNRLEEYHKNLDRLVSLSLEFLKLQTELTKTGKYLYSTFEEVNEYVHEDKDRMIALYFSQIFWVIHYKLNEFFLDEICSSEKKQGEILEVPTGSGIFLANFLSRNKGWNGTAIDISKLTIQLAKKTFKAFKIPKNSLEIIEKDLFKYNSDKKYDIILCGEFLEHVEDPLKVLKQLHSLLKDDGKIFLTAAVYTAQVDHIYLYKNAQEVRDHILEAGFKIEKELVQNVFPGDKVEDSKVPINYSAIITK